MTPREIFIDCTEEDTKDDPKDDSNLALIIIIAIIVIVVIIVVIFIVCHFYFQRVKNYFFPPKPETGGTVGTDGKYNPFSITIKTLDTVSGKTVKKDGESASVRGYLKNNSE